MRDPFDIGNRQVRVSASIGLALSGVSTDEPADLLRHADAAMYRAPRATGVTGWNCSTRRSGPHWPGG